MPVPSSSFALLLATVTTAAACTGRDRTPATADPTPAPQPPPEPRRVAAEVPELRRMLAEVVAVRACDRLRGMFRPIGGGGGGDAPATGVAWIQECTAREHGAEVTLELAGRGWEWVSRTTEQAGAEFSIQEYVPYAFTLEVRGTIDVAYAPDAKVFTAWFTPVGPPEATFQPKGALDVDTEGVWGSLVSGVASALATSPEARAEQRIARTGARRFEEMFADGLAVTVDLCAGHVRTGLGHPPAGEMLGTPPPVERASAVLHRDGLIVRGPVRVPDGGLELEVRGDGAVVARLVCMDQAATIARGYLEGSLGDVPALDAAEVRDRAVLDAPGATCPLALAIEPAELAGDRVEVGYTVSELAADVPPLATCDE